MTTLLIAQGVRRWFVSGDERVVPLDGVDLTVDAGEVVVVTGPSGSGKTTLLQMAAGFERPDEGTIRWTGAASGRPGWDVVAVVPQSLGLFAELTAVENVALPLLARGSRPAAARDAAGAAMASLAVDQLADRLAGETSLGQQQRLAVARALVGSPSLIIADEPTSHQDGAHAELVLAAIVAAARRGAGCLVAGHDQRLTAVADRVVRLQDGRLTGWAG